MPGSQDPEIPGNFYDPEIPGFINRIPGYPENDKSTNIIEEYIIKDFSK
jgi:hypothetical protein